MEAKNESITARAKDFAQWYTDVCRKAELMDYSPLRGFVVLRPAGYALWEGIRSYLDVKFKENGIENVYMPLLIPESLFDKEKEHVQGFAPEVFAVTEGGGEKLPEKLIIRPTSETLFCAHYARIIGSYRDLPKRYNQWCDVVRDERSTRPFLRGSEFLWQEGHTIYETGEEARHDALRMLEIYDVLGRDLLAIPFVKGRKTDKEKFAGALTTYGVEALLPDGKSLQCGTSHYFGDGFAKAFGIRYLGRDNRMHYPFQASWGVSTRLIGALVMVHGDDNGLVLPPRLAPAQLVIVPIRQNEPAVLAKAREYLRMLKDAGVRAILDDSDHTPGWKYSEHEMRGVPLRLEIGPRDVARNAAVLVKRNDGKKVVVAEEDLASEAKRLLEDIHREMYEKAYGFLLSRTEEAHDLAELKSILERGGYAKVMWCGDRACEDRIKELFQATARVIPFEQHPFGDTCPVCGKKAGEVVLFAKAY